jgi:hypothetical protein
MSEEVGSEATAEVRTKTKTKTKTLRSPRLSRRRYQEVTKLLKEVIANKSASVERRMRAADTLLAVYDRQDRAMERKTKKDTSAITAEAEVEAGPQDFTEPEVKNESTEDAAQRLLDRIAVRIGAQEGVTELEDDNE